MAVAKAINANDIINGLVTIQPTPFGTSRSYYDNTARTQHLADVNGFLLTNENSRYKTGGGTGWERPGSNLT